MVNIKTLVVSVLSCLSVAQDSRVKTPTFSYKKFNNNKNVYSNKQLEFIRTALNGMTSIYFVNKRIEPKKGKVM